MKIDLLPPAPKFSISKWLLSVIIATSVIGGGLVAMAVLFLADGFFDIGRDPVVQEEQNSAQEAKQDAEFNKRLAALEQQAAQAPTSQETAPVTTAPNANEARMAQIVVGLTQLKTAYENDVSLLQGINTLKQAIKDTTVQENLQALTVIATEQFPSKESILQQIAALQTPAAPPAATPADKNVTWQQRAAQAARHFVTITKTEDLAQQKTLASLYEQLTQAVSFDNFALATQLAAKLPASEQLYALATNLQTRLKAQQLVQKTISAVGTALQQPPEGALY